MKLKNKHRLTKKEALELKKLIKKHNPTCNSFFVIDDNRTDFKRYNHLMSKIIY